MSTKEIDKIIDNLNTVFRGDAWHGPSLMEIIQSLPENIVSQKHGFSKRTICELVFHLTAWRKFVIQKLDDNIHFSLDTEEDNYGTKELTLSSNWKNLIEDLKNTHKELNDKLESFDDTLLERRVAGEDYDFYKLLTGLIQHDTYHLGMIWVLWE